ncbi:MAG: hypothetical protein RL661_1400 [Pseudomonadota bacterium]|jgi:hypothetical protein
MNFFREFLTWIPWDIVAVFVASICLSAAITFLLNAPAAISLPTKDFQCTESAIVNGVPECVEYRRKEK